MKIKCRDIYNYAKSDLGYDEAGAVTEIENINKKAVDTVNHVYRLIFFKLYTENFKPLTGMDESVDLPEKIIFNVLIPGVASKIAFDWGDTKQQSYFAQMYNQGLKYMNVSGSIKDVLPSDYMN